jgi:Fe-S-cluster containining protein
MNYWLSMHAGYRCQHAGACCTSRWPIPLERSRVEIVRRAVADGRIAVPEPWLTSAADAPPDIGGVLALNADASCVFHEHERCAIHSELGHDALPSACQHFPRVCTIDPRGVFVTLSHFCPTAAWLLFVDEPVTVVEGPAPWPGHELPEGLDAREGWPPLLTAQLLMDHESYALWERRVVGVLAGVDGVGTTPEAALARIRAATEQLTQWTPVDGALLDAVRDVASHGASDGGHSREGRHSHRGHYSHQGHHPYGGRYSHGGHHFSGAGSAEGALGQFALVRRAVPPGLTWGDAPRDFDRVWTVRVAATWPEWAPVIRRFLAAHAFGSWLAYQGRGLLTIVRSLDAALAVLQVEIVRACESRETTLDRATLHHAIRQADLLLRHHVDRQALADAMASH